MVKDLNYVTPEQEGLASEDISEFLRLLKKRKKNIHSFMLIKNGNILVEKYCKPFDENFKHRLYSSSKTIVSLAIGKLIGEGKISLSDKIADLLPDLVEKDLDARAKNCTVEDALKMSVSMPCDTYFDRKWKEWASSFFNRYDSIKPAGTIFHYNTSGTFILDVIVEKITGKTFLEYLRPEFDEIGVSKDITCVKSPDGYLWGGSGVICTLRDYAKIAELLLHRGNYNGKQLLPYDYMLKATTKQISNLCENQYTRAESCGYGYQVWITACGFAMYGMGCQMAYCFPDKDFIAVFQGDTQCGSDYTASMLYYLVEENLYDKIKSQPLPENKNAYSTLQNNLDDYGLITDFGESHSEYEKEINGVKYVLDENPTGWKWFRFDFYGEKGTLTYENSRGEKQITFGCGKYVKGTFPETHYYDMQVDVPANRELDAMFIANWTEEKKILVRNYIIDTNFGNCFMTFGFKNDEVGVLMSKRAEFFMDDYAGMFGGRREK